MVDLNDIQRNWTRRFGATATRRMMKSAYNPTAAYDSIYGHGDYARSGALFGAGFEQGRRYGRDQTDLIPTGRPGSRAEEEPDQRYPTGRGRDQQEGGDPLEQVKTFLRHRLSQEDFARLEQMLQALAGGEGEEPDDGGPSDGAWNDPSQGRGARDNPPRFKGMPQPGGSKFGQDSRGDSYFDAFPANAHVDVWNYGRR